MRRVLILALAAATAPVVGPLVGPMVGPAVAAAPSPLRVEAAWVRPAPPGAPTGAGYLVVRNTGRSADRLLSVSTPAADRIEVHEMSMAGGVMRMRAVAGGLEVPAGGELRLAPGGLHLMWIGPKAPLTAGRRLPATLRFARAGAVAAMFEVRSDAPPAPARR